MRINRERLLQRLEAVQAGLSPKEVVQQSSCYIFSKGQVLTYNDEIACSCESDLDKKFTGAVQATPLLEILRKLPEEEIDTRVGDGEFLIIGKRRRSGVRMENEITMDLAALEKPDGWKPLPEDFGEALGMVVRCASKDESEFGLTCVHIAKNWVESCDNFQMLRYRIKVGVEKPVLVRRSSIQHVTSMDMTEFSETETWIHFRNPSGLVFSCRRYIEDYKELSSFFKVTGQPTNLPKGLGDAAEKAEVFSGENPEDNQILVEMRPGKIRIKGQGISGWYSEIKKLAYKGKAISFLISPQLLIELTKRHNNALIGENVLKVDGGNFVYIASLGKVDNDKNKEE